MAAAVRLLPRAAAAVGEHRCSFAASPTKPVVTEAMALICPVLFMALTA